MNVIILDLLDEISDDGLVARIDEIAGQPCRVCRMTRTVGSDGPPIWTLRCLPGSTIVRTRREPGGLLSAALLTVDEFPADEELVVLTSEADHWATHFQRLHEVKDRPIDVFLSFDPDGSGGFVFDPHVTTLLRLINGITPGLAWYRATEFFYASTKQLMRKDARWNGQFTVDVLLRELVLQDARVGYHSRAMDGAFPTVA